MAKRTPTARIRKALLERQLAEPVFVDRAAYERALDASLKKFDRGLAELDKVKRALAAAAARAGRGKTAKELKLAIARVEDSIVAFGWDQLPYHYRNKKRMMIWPAASKARRR